MAGTIKTTELPNAGVLDGTERLALVVGSTSKQSTTRQIADLAGPLQGGGAAQSVAALRLVTPPTVNGVTIQTLGYYVANDGGGVLYQWSSSSASADNGNTVIRPSTSVGAGRWLMVYGATANVLQFGAKTDGATDCLAAFQAAIATGLTVLIPEIGTAYALSNYFEPQANQEVSGVGMPTLKMIGSSRFLRIVSKSNVTVRNMVVDCSTDGLTNNGSAFMQNCVNCLVENVSLAEQYGTWFVTGTGAYGNRLSRINITDARSVNGLTLNAGAHHNTIELCEIRNTVLHTGTFNGIRGSNGTNNNFILNNRGYGLGGELVAFERSTYFDQILGNYVEWTGDNGYSYTGNDGVIVGNVAKYCDFGGIYLYGENNTCVGNNCTSNGQASLISGVQYGGIMIGGFWGGLGIYNNVVGNTTNDEQAVPTQYCGVKLSGRGYTDWATGQTISSTDTYRINGQNVYKADSTGVTGSTAPTVTSGIEYDGGVYWEYINTYPSSREAWRNTVGPNRNITSGAGGAVLDETTNQTNFILRDDRVEFFGSNGDNVVTGGFKFRGQPWTSGQAILWGDYRYNSSPGLYVCTNLGGTCSVQPTHTSGTVTGADGIAWTYVAASTQRFYLLDTLPSGTRFGTVLSIPNLSSPGTYVTISCGNGTPEGVVTAPVGSWYQRADGGAGTSFYVKESGSDATGWVGK